MNLHTNFQHDESYLGFTFIEAINSLVGAADNGLLWDKLGLIERSFIPGPVDHFRPLGEASSILNMIVIYRQNIFRGMFAFILYISVSRLLFCIANQKFKGASINFSEGDVINI